VVGGGLASIHLVLENVPFADLLLHEDGIEHSNELLVLCGFSGQEAALVKPRQYPQRPICLVYVVERNPQRHHRPWSRIAQLVRLLPFFTILVPGRF
jgi:hypothetical protein